MLQVMIYKGYFLTRRDTARELMRRVYLRAYEKTMLSLHLSSVWSRSAELWHSLWAF